MTTYDVPEALAIQAELSAIARELHELSDRLDRAGADDTVDGVAAMSIDVASQAVHLALVELRDCCVPA